MVAVIEPKKPSAKPIVDPAVFLFGCLKKMEINPPPGWKSRAVRMMEDEERRLKEEAEGYCQLSVLRLKWDALAERWHRLLRVYRFLPNLKRLSPVRADS